VGPSLFVPGKKNLKKDGVEGGRRSLSWDLCENDDK